MTDSPRRSSRLPLVTLSMVLILAMIGWPALPNRSTAQVPVAPIDLAALLPGVTEMAAAGLADMAGSSPIDLDTIDAYESWSGGEIPETVEGLRAAGFVRHYGMTWQDAASENTYRETGGYAPVTQVDAYAWQFADPAGASTGFALLEAGSTPLPDVTIPLGDEATASEVPPVEYTDGTTGTGVDLTVRSGSIGIGISVVSRDPSPVRGSELAIATQLLTGAMTALQSLPAPPTTGPGLEAARFAGTAAGYLSGFYVIRGGQSAWSYSTEPAEQREQVTADEVAAGLVSQYAVYQYLQTATGGFYDLYTYAATYGTPEQALAAVDAATIPVDGFTVTPLEGAPTFGERSSAYTLTDATGTVFESYVVWASGASVYMVRLGLASRLPAPAAVYAVATAQAACLGTGTCWQYQAIPDALIADTAS